MVDGSVFFQSGPLRLRGNGGGYNHGNSGPDNTSKPMVFARKLGDTYPCAHIRTWTIFWLNVMYLQLTSDQTHIKAAKRCLRVPRDISPRSGHRRRPPADNKRIPMVFEDLFESIATTEGAPSFPFKFPLLLQPLELLSTIQTLTVSFAIVRNARTLGPNDRRGARYHHDAKGF